MKNNAKSYGEIIALIGIALIVTDIARTSQAREFADISKFTKIEIPAAFGSGALPSGINPRGDIVGTYTAIINQSSNSLGFLLSKGTFTTIDVPGSIPGSTNAAGINPQGDIVGFYASDNGNIGFGFDEKGFLLRKGAFTAIEAPGSTFTVTNGINPQGDMVGFYIDSSGNGHAFLLSKGAFTSIDVPGALAGSTFTSAIDAQGDIVGTYTDRSGIVHGFLLSKGTLTNIDVPGALAGSTNPTAINPERDIVGTYSVCSDGSCSPHGFLLSK